MPDILQSLLENAGVEIFAVIATVVLIIVAFAWGQRRMQSMSNSWLDVAQQHGLQFVENPVTYDYGDFVGERTWQFPGMAGDYRGRQIQVQGGAGLEGREAGRFRFEGVVQLKSSVPFTALVYKNKFTDGVKARIAKDTPTKNRAIDSQFKVRSEDTQFVVNLLERIDISQWLKQHKFRTANITLDGDQLAFAGAAGHYSGKPEEAIDVLDMLCDVADMIEV